MLLWILLLLGFLLPASARADAGREAPVCHEESSLSRAAAELLLQAAAPSPERLTEAVREAGSDAVGVHALFVREPEADGHAWLARLAKSSDAPLSCGFAESSGGRLVLAAARAGWIEPLTRKSTRVRARLGKGFEQPELVLSDADGQLQRIRLDREQLSDGVAIDEELKRPIRVQLLGRGAAGPRPVAERVLPAADRPASEPSPAPGEPNAASSAKDPEAPAPDLEGRLLELREREGQRPLRDNALLARVATGYAERVCAEGRVVHELTSGENPERRLRSAGVEARRVGETVARAKDALAAFEAFEHSPSHRMTLLEPSFTDAGIGSAKDDKGHACVVVVLAAWPRFVGR